MSLLDRLQLHRARSLTRRHEHHRKDGAGWQCPVIEVARAWKLPAQVEPGSTKKSPEVEPGSTPVDHDYVPVTEADMARGCPWGFVG
ncbi:hypothetical protein [Piscinibacter defluvii]|uniref:hypothetical protein n=1 Tax=Piscinibacter defluvii TaxID=1796922 RepID=UPI000FDD00EC|nr:hypothetical protein [Piscinibacter defluvii]